MDIDSNGIKGDPDVKIKDDPDMSSDSGEEDDKYEDTGELTIPKSKTRAWLVRMPKDLWSTLAHMKKDDDEVKLGQVKVWSMKDGGQKVGFSSFSEAPLIKLQVRWYLNSEFSESESGPGKPFEFIHKEYDLNIQNPPRNTFFFSEKDLPGYKGHVPGRVFNRSQGRDTRKNDGRVGKSRFRGTRTIPKQTAFVAAPEHEVHCTPRENAEWYKLQNRKEDLAKSVRKDLTVTDVGRMLDMDRMSDRFLRVAEQKKTRPQDLKFSRLESDVLLNLLAQKFKQYKYWSLRRLKEETRQPEAHLRDELSKIAYLVKTGPAANHWTLRSEMAEALNLNPAEFAQADGARVKQEDIAPAAANLDDDDDMDEDMEDVPLP
jgi:transcription initiation factor TFIIF subunit beta